jgi:hypothetical protein
MGGQINHRRLNVSPEGGVGMGFLVFTQLRVMLGVVMLVMGVSMAANIVLAHVAGRFDAAIIFVIDGVF